MYDTFLAYGGATAFALGTAVTLFGVWSSSRSISWATRNTAVGLLGVSVWGLAFLSSISAVAFKAPWVRWVTESSIAAIVIFLAALILAKGSPDDSPRGRTKPVRTVLAASWVFLIGSLLYGEVLRLHPPILGLSPDPPSFTLEWPVVLAPVVVILSTAFWARRYSPYIAIASVWWALASVLYHHGIAGLSTVTTETGDVYRQPYAPIAIGVLYIGAFIRGASVSILIAALLPPKLRKTQVV